MQARGVSASLCYPSTSAICTWARTWLAAPGPPWKWGGGSVASAGPAPRHEFDEPVIAMLPRVLYVYWGFHSWWCSRQRGGLHGLLIWRVCVCACAFCACVIWCVCVCACAFCARRVCSPAACMMSARRGIPLSSTGVEEWGATDQRSKQVGTCFQMKGKIRHQSKAKQSRTQQTTPQPPGSLGRVTSQI